MEIYTCSCGCNILFNPLILGHTIYIGDKGKYMITDCRMVNYSWKNYIINEDIDTWGDLRNRIINNYNIYKNEDNPIYKPWVHLYNEHCTDDTMRQVSNEKLYYEYIF